MRKVVAVGVVATLASSFSARAFERGDTCTLRAPLQITISSKAGTLETALDPGTDVEVVAVGEEGRLRVSTGDAKGSVATRDLEAACAGTLQMCRLTDGMLVYEKNHSDSKSWKLKPGAPLSVLRSGKVWAHVRINDLEAFAKVDDLRPRCPLQNGGDVQEAGGEPVTEEVDRGEGPGVLFLPFLVEKGAPVGVADQLGDEFYEHLASYRPDAARLGDDGDRAVSSNVEWRKFVTARAARARGAGLAYVVVGKVTVEPKAAGADASGDSGFTVSMVVVDSASGATVKGVRARASGRPEDPWAESMLTTLLPMLRQAPGARTPAKPGPTKTLGVSPTSTTAPAPAPPPRTTAEIGVEPTSWYANPWGYVALGTGALAGVGAGVIGNLAVGDNNAANAAAPVSDDRATLREQAFIKAITADSLAGVAGIAVVTGVVVFATRAGIPD